MDGWFANRGQIIQTGISIIACVFGGVNAWPKLKGNEFVSVEAILFYLLVALLIVSLVLAVRAIRREPGLSGKPIPPRSASDHLNIKLIDLFPECFGLDSQWTYKSKIRLYFRNETGSELIVENLAWADAPKGLPAQGPIGCRFQMEGPNGWEAENWLQEQDTVRVPTGMVFRLWIGLWLDPETNPNQRNAELRRRAMAKSLGTVTLTIRHRDTPSHWKIDI